MNRMEAKQLTDNEIIAEFMGFDVYDYELFGNMTRVYSPKTNDSVLRALTMHNINQLKYHQSWDWLMPVVEKIERIKGIHLVISELGCDIYSFGKRVYDSREDTKIKTVYKAVVEFIKWYSNQPQKA